MSRFLEFRVPIWPQIIRSIVVFFSTFSQTSIQDKARSPHVLCHTYKHIKVTFSPCFSTTLKNVVGHDFRARTPRLPAGRAIYLRRSLTHNVGKSGRCVCVCALQQGLKMTLCINHSLRLQVNHIYGTNHFKN